MWEPKQSFGFTGGGQRHFSFQCWENSSPERAAEAQYCSMRATLPSGEAWKQTATPAQVQLRVTSHNWHKINVESWTQIELVSRVALNNFRGTHFLTYLQRHRATTIALVFIRPGFEISEISASTPIQWRCLWKWKNGISAVICLSRNSW